MNQGMQRKERIICPPAPHPHLKDLLILLQPKVQPVPLPARQLTLVAGIYNKNCHTEQVQTIASPPNPSLDFALPVRPLDHGCFTLCLSAEYF